MRIGHRAKGLIATAAALLVAACATPTPYQPLGAQGTGASGGYANVRIAADRYRVTFAGNSLTSRERVETYLLYRAAELTLEQGYDSFTIVERATDRNVETRVYRDPFGPGPYRWWRPSWRYRGSFGWRTWDPWFGDPFWGDSIDVSTIQRFETDAEIVMSHGRRANDTKSFDAHEVIANLGPSIEVPREGRGRGS
jgi:hypothetical protein